MNNKFRRFMRKSHRIFAIPVVLVVLLKVVTLDTVLSAFVQPIAVFTMIFMIISGVIIYFQPKKIS